MRAQKGSVVKATAGRDGGGYFVVTDVQGRCCYIADGKVRRLSSPKKKNIKHLSFTDSMIDLNDITDRKLRKLLAEYPASE